MESLSPCAKPECRRKNKLECSESCLQLARYQQYLIQTEDRFSPPGIDYSDHDRIGLNAADALAELEMDNF